MRKKPKILRAIQQISNGMPVETLQNQRYNIIVPVKGTGITMMAYFESEGILMKAISSMIETLKQCSEIITDMANKGLL